MKWRSPNRFLIAQNIFEELAFQSRLGRGRRWRRVRCLGLCGEVRENKCEDDYNEAANRNAFTSHGTTPEMFASRGDYLLTTSTTNVPGLMLRCGRPPGVEAGVSTYSAVVRKIFFV